MQDLVLLENIFESLNNAGLGLNNADLVKNSLIRGTEGQEKKKIAIVGHDFLDMVDEIANSGFGSHTFLGTKRDNSITRIVEENYL